MTLYLKLDMVEEHWTMYLGQVVVVVTTSSIGVTPTTLEYRDDSTNPMIEARPTFDNGPLHTNQRECVLMSTNPSMMGHRVASPNSGPIIGEGAAYIYRHDGNYVDCFGLTDGFVN